MIISKQVEIKISSKNKSHYIKKGYNAIYGEKIIVNVNDLPPSSKTIIKVKCDVCKQSFKQGPHVYPLKNQNKSCFKEN